MENLSDSKIIYEHQVAACKTFFQEQLPSDGIKPLSEAAIPPNLKQFNGKVFDITGLDAQQVVGILSHIVNTRDDFTPNKTFYLLIKGADHDVDFEEVYRLRARPTKQQPGNAIVFLRPKGKVRFERSATTYEELNGKLEASYDTIPKPTKCFATHIKQLFKDNKQICVEEIPSATIEAYMLLLFEIARRLVKSEKPSAEQVKFDVLPIGSAIAGLVTLLEFGDAEKCKFMDVFLPKKKFHCFTGKPEDRKAAVYRINHALGATPSNNSKKYYVEELQQLFCSEKRYEQQLAATLKNLNFRIQAHSSLSEADSSSSEAETYTAFDHCG